MHSHRYPLLPSRHISLRLQILIAAMGCRRWLSRPWQVTLGHYMVLVAVSATGLVVFNWPRPMAIFLLTLALALFGCLRLRWHGFRIADIVTLLAIMLVAVAILLPAMRETRDRTAGKRFFPFAVPQQYVELLYGRD
jgi:hypothetical protein